MGNFFSCNIDSIDYVDRQITSMIFPNPTYMTIAEIENLGKLPNYKFTYVTSANKNNISMLEIIPDYCVSNKIIIYSHGNGENLYTLNSFMKELANFLKVPVIGYDYIGYGASKGKPSEIGCYESIHTIVNYVKHKNPKKEILLMGMSLGTGVVMEYITKTGWIKPVLLIATYKSIPRVIYDNSSIGSLVKHNHFDNINKIQKAKCPILFIHGKNDTLISCHHTVDLHDALPNKKFPPLYIDKAGHNDILKYLNKKIFNDLFENF